MEKLKSIFDEDYVVSFRWKLYRIFIGTPKELWRTTKVFISNIFIYRALLVSARWYETFNSQYKALQISIQQYVDANEQGKAFICPKFARNRLKQAKIALELLDRLINDRNPLSEQYELETKVSDVHYDKRGRKSYSVEFTWHKNFSQSPNINSRGAYKISHNIEKYYHDYLYDIMKKHSNGWWD